MTGPRPPDSQALLLAAGRGRRAGGPKAWLEHEGRPLLERQMEFLLTLFPPRGIAVSVQEGWLERCRAISGEVRWVAVDPDLPPLAALQALIRAADPGLRSFVYHVDMPVWEESLFRDLSRAAEDGALAVVPTHQGRGGHPVLLSAEGARTIACLDPDRDRLDLWLRSATVTRVEVGLPCVRVNWNRLPGDR